MVLVLTQKTVSGGVGDQAVERDVVSSARALRKRCRRTFVSERGPLSFRDAHAWHDYVQRIRVGRHDAV